MKFAQFSKYLEKLESVSSRLEITKILADFIGNLTPQETISAIFLTLGTIGPRYEAVEFGVSDKLMMRIIARAYSTELIEVLKLFKANGDLGSVAQELSAKRRGQNEKLSVGEIFEKLGELAGASGQGSVERKINLGADLLQSLDPLSVRFVVRIPLGTMRLGFSEKTVLEALAALRAGGEISFAKGSTSRAIKEALERKYNAYPNIGEIATRFVEKGLDGLRSIKVKVGAPIEPQLCARLETAAEMVKRVGDSEGRVAAEYKYDGMRLQAHLDRSAQNQKSQPKAGPPRAEKISSPGGSASGGKNQNLALEGFANDVVADPRVRMYTRNFEQMQSVFPDLTVALIESVKAQTAIIDGEAVGVDLKTGKFIPFQETIQRKRKYNIEEMVKKIPVKYFAFDILYKDGEDLMELPYLKRREILNATISKNEKIFISQSITVNNPTELQDYFKEAKNKGLEGLIVKNTQSSYEAGNRGFSWVKFKREETGSLTDTIDCVVLGYYKGTGKRSDFGIGALLVGILDDKNDKFLTIAKIGTGLTDEEWVKIKNQISKIKIQKVPGNIEISKELIPDVLCVPEIVVQIRADEISVSPAHSSGYALRFPRMMGYRTDKSSEQATSLTELRQLYKMQEKK